MEAENRTIKGKKRGRKAIPKSQRMTIIVSVAFSEEERNQIAKDFATLKEDILDPALRRHINEGITSDNFASFVYAYTRYNLIGSRAAERFRQDQALIEHLRERKEESATLDLLHALSPPCKEKIDTLESATSTDESKE